MAQINPLTNCSVPKSMKAEIMIYIGASLPLFWGIAHLFPTKSVVRDFGEISDDNRNIIAMEWVIEGIALMFTGFLVALVTYIESQNSISTAVYITASGFLVVLAVVSVFTGFKISFLPFRLCPIVFTSSAILIAVGWILLG